MLTIRRATAEDAQAIATLNVPVQRLHHESRPGVFKPPCDGAEMVGHYVEVLENPDNYIFIGEVDGVPVGYVSCQVYRRPANPYSYARNFVYVDQISVNPDQRSKGYGKQLSEMVIEVARQEKISQITLSVWAFNTDAIEFYEKLGFRRLIQSMEFVLDGDTG
jgi:ribosomal protein S18 acetylase RimI-like enzyme